MNEYCTFCQNFNYDELVTFPGYRHHASWKNLTLAASTGCALCTLVVHNASDRSQYGMSSKWQEVLENDEQVYCKLSSGLITWKYGDNQRAQLAVFTSDDDNLSSIIQMRPVFDHVFSSGSMSMMRGWLNKCYDEHKACTRLDEDHELPTRVLDVGRATGQPYLMASNGRWGRWAALSHCWGGFLEVKTTKKNIERYYGKNGMTFNTLPSTFQDALVVARGLGIDYLWIDALCIIQDDPDDWEREAERMNYVYRYATITIAAEASPESGVGIQNSMKAARQSSTQLPCVSCHSPGRGVQGKIHFRENYLQYNGGTDRGYLSTRAWTMQEEVLSSRILRFSEQQVIWHCSEADWSEWSPQLRELRPWDFAQGLSKTMKNLPEPDADYVTLLSTQQRRQLLDFWYMNVVNYYAGRDVTYKTDKLIAVYGIAKEILARLDGYDYTAGIFYSNMGNADVHKGLSWHVPVPNAVTNRSQYVAPSWSWASVEFAFDKESIARHCFVYEMKLLTSMTLLATDINFSSYTEMSSSLSPRKIERHVLSIQGESLEVCSCIIPQEFFDQKSSDPDMAYHYRFDRISERHNRFMQTIGLQALHDRKCHSLATGEHKRYVYLQLGRWEPEVYMMDGVDGMQIPVIIALILEEVGSKLEPRHRRVGRALIPTDRSQNIRWDIESFSIV